MNQAADSPSTCPTEKRDLLAKHTVVIAIGEPNLSAELRGSLELLGRYEVAGQTSSAPEATSLLQQTRPDFLLIDLELVRTLGTSLEQLRDSPYRPRVLLLADDAKPEELEAVLDAGVLGFLSRDMSAHFLDAALRHVLSGGCVIAPSVLKALKEGANTSGSPFAHAHDRIGLLNESEGRVLRLLGYGYDNARIASEFVLSLASVKTYVSRVLKKLRLDNRTQAALVANEMRLTR
ncbi:response regulator transcription factor [Streptomyces sp. MS2.AVA.5]|uniref:Response regulator transcription factor n=1 Tax=Streptomyces achmelvichensis TaxID=3134111 RepID=A0ACC6PLA6_9ACTN